MISLTLTNVKNTMAHLLLKETFDRFSFIEGEIVTFNTFKFDGYLQKEFFHGEEEPEGSEEYSHWADVRDFCFSLIKGIILVLIPWHFIGGTITLLFSILLPPSKRALSTLYPFI